MPHYILLYCTILYCTVLYCTVLYCTVLYCTVLYRTVLYCTVLYCTVLYYTIHVSSEVYKQIVDRASVHTPQNERHRSQRQEALFFAPSVDVSLRQLWGCCPGIPAGFW